MANTQTEDALGLKPGARGRKDNSGQEVEPDHTKVESRLDDLLAGKKKAEAAGEAYSTLVKAVAKDAGMNAGAVRQFVDARSGEHFEATARKVAQLHLMFTEIGAEDEDE